MPRLTARSTNREHEHGVCENKKRLRRRVLPCTRHARCGERKQRSVTIPQAQSVVTTGAWGYFGPRVMRRTNSRQGRGGEARTRGETATLPARRDALKTCNRVPDPISDVLLRQVLLPSQTNKSTNIESSCRRRRPSLFMSAHVLPSPVHRCFYAKRVNVRHGVSFVETSPKSLKRKNTHHKPAHPRLCTCADSRVFETDIAPVVFQQLLVINT